MGVSGPGRRRDHNALHRETAAQWAAGWQRQDGRAAAAGQGDGVSPSYLLDFNEIDILLPLAHECRQQLKKKSHNPQATGQNKSENYGPTTRRIDSAAVGQIKGIPIHPPEGSCSGYPLIPYSAASDACSRRCVNPAAK